MNQVELKEKYMDLYDYMSNSKNPRNMMIFGRVMTSMMEDMIVSSPAKADDYISRLEAVKWDNFLSPSEADRIVSEMSPKAPWTREQWRTAMEQNGFALEKWPCYNKCALYVTMQMIMSDSSSTLSKYVDKDDMFKVVYDLAVDKLTDIDKKFDIRKYFGV